MRIWSVLRWDTWHTFEREGLFRRTAAEVPAERREAQEWMALQMCARLKTPRPSADSMPIWAWCGDSMADARSLT